MNIHQLHEIAAAWIVVGGIFIAIGEFKGKAGYGWSMLGAVIMFFATTAGV